MNDLEQNNMLQPLVDEIETTVSNAKKELAEKVNSVITQTYWTIGKYIVEFEQDGNVKAAYGSKLLTTLSHQLTLRLGRGYSRPNLNNMRKFYLCYENCQTVSDKFNFRFYVFHYVQIFLFQLFTICSIKILPLN